MYLGKLLCKNRQNQHFLYKLYTLLQTVTKQIQMNDDFAYILINYSILSLKFVVDGVNCT
jgi:hypothetical protein